LIDLIVFNRSLVVKIMFDISNELSTNKLLENQGAFILKSNDACIDLIKKYKLSL
jgi:hypothetical protein